ncbi:hypothetical protein ABH922_001685 [Rhodococcus sp. 27YEA15]|uniref:Pr6Pr family membrane protein n=1 Tax=Rhodococcus sp. 27YEA15 TaxID=3156259 RepID=UPI003C79DA84
MTKHDSVTPFFVRIFRVVFAAYGLMALLWIPIRNEDGFVLADYLSYFTIESNILTAVVLVVGAVRDPQSRRWQYFRGAVTMYMVITGIIYALLLSDVDVQSGDAWTNTALHRVLPLVLLLDWVLMPSRHRIPLQRTLVWLSFPLGYGIYSLIRGSLVEWYPYPFLDPGQSGYLEVVIGLVVLWVSMGVMGVAVVVAGRIGARRRYGADAEMLALTP